MNRESKVRKERTCLSCEEKFLVTAQGLKYHASTCKRMKALGLIGPEIIVSTPDLVIRRYDD